MFIRETAVRAALAAVAGLSSVGVAHADLVFNNGLVNDFSGAATGAVIVADSVDPPAHTTLNYLAGASNSIGSDLNATGSSTVNIFTGSLVGDDMNATDASMVNIYGGTITDDIRVRDASVVHLYGGSIGDSVAARETATLFVHGYGFNYAYGSISDDTGVLSGFLSDGTAFSYAFDRGTVGAYTGSIVLVEAVPSPAGLAVLALAGLVRSRRR